MIDRQKTSKATKILHQLNRRWVRMVVNLMAEIDRPITVTEIQEVFAQRYGVRIRQDETSRALAILRRLGAATCVRRGRCIDYELNQEFFSKVRTALNHLKSEHHETVN